MSKIIMNKVKLATLRAEVASAAQKLRSVGCKKLAFPEDLIYVASPSQLKSWLFWSTETYKNLYA